MAIISFVGWFIFVIFGGLGLSALPLDLIMEFVHRPKIRKSSDVAETKIQLKRTTEGLLKLGEELRGIIC